MPIGLQRLWVPLLAVTLAVSVSPALAEPADQDVFTDFEGIATALGEPFQIGPSGSRAEFSGNARALDVGPAARSGTNAWIVQDASAVGTITFVDAPATAVELYASAAGNPFGMFIRAFDPDGVLIGSPVFVGGGYTLVSFTGPIGRIDVSNEAAGVFVYVDDFGYSTGASPSVPSLGPSALALLIAVLVLAGGLVAHGHTRTA